ncbi:MAG: T9SS type A sorting domain-containing protein [Aureispira sp.]|nr:T9SS type A sorting domain-containing protein [Aureispira sp.]
MKVQLVLCISLLLGCLTTVAQTPTISVHQQELEHYNNLGLTSDQAFDKLNGFKELPKFGVRSACALDKIVFGWHPYWSGSAYLNYDWSLLTDLSFFSYEVDPNTGNANTTHGWSTAAVIDTAIANGVRVNLCVTMFSGHSTFFGSSTAQQTLITNLINLVQTRGANGVNIDFEGIPSSQKTNFTNFMIDLANQMHTAIPNSQVSTVLYAVDWNGIFDVPALSAAVDLFIIMGYDYYYSGSGSAGPNDPLYSFTTGYNYSLSRSITDYVSKGMPLQKLVLGLPYYGREWPTVANTLPSNTTGTGVSRTFKYIKNNSSGNYSNPQWDVTSQTPYHVFNDGTSWRQCFAMDAQGLESRLDIVLKRGIAGMGIWALGYDDGYLDLWNVIREKMTPCRTSPCVDTLYDMGGPNRNYYNKENYIYTIDPVSPNPLNVTFNSFDVELNYDYLRLYDGLDTSAPLIGVYTGTNSPGTVIANSGALTLLFTSDGATTSPGWSAVYDCGLPNNVYQDTILMAATNQQYLNCGLAYHTFFDSGGPTGSYGNNESATQTFCSTDTTQAIRLSFRPNPTSNEQLKLSSTTIGNDYLYIYNGASSNDNLVGVYTGSTSTAPQPGTFVSSGHCLTVKMESDATDISTGWHARLYCVAPPTNNGTTLVGGTVGNQTFTDLGGASANYGNNESYTKTYCPDASTPNNEVVWAAFDSLVAIESNWDYLYVFDGDDTEQSRLICAYTGDTSNTNTLGTIKASTANTSGCLTFQFFSDGADNTEGWEATMTTGPARLAYGSDICSDATFIGTENAVYAGSTTLATGTPGSNDPALNISIASLPECSGSNTITRLENTVWYTFRTIDTFCIANQIAVKLNNISCQSISTAGSGVQFVLYEVGACQNGVSWGNPIYCADKLTNGDSVVITSLLQPSTTYYIMIDGFTGQHCNFDIWMENQDSNSCIITDIEPAVEQEMGLKVYPNPVSRELNLELAGHAQSSYRLSLFDLTGKQVWSQTGRVTYSNELIQVPMQRLVNGIYTYRLVVDRQQYTGKIRKD